MNMSIKSPRWVITDSGTAANGIINHLVSKKGSGMVRPTAFALAGRH